MIDAIKDKVVGTMLKREKTASGLILPDSSQDPQAFVKVTSVGEDVTGVKVGDIVVSHIRGGMDVVLDKTIIKVLKNDEIYGVLTDEATIALLEDIVLQAAPEKPRIVKP